MNISTLLNCVIDVLKILTRKFGFLRAVLILAGAIFRTNHVFNNTTWGKQNTAEAKYVKSIALFPAIYLQLKEKLDTPNALTVMNEIVIAISSDVDHATIKKHGLMKITDPFARWQKYRKELSAEGFGLFNKITDVEATQELMHYIVHRCIFHEFLTQAGAAEITHFICDYDRMAHEKLFPEYEFSRNGSWENTLGHGRDCCHYVWQVKSSLPKSG
jgi:hypothetical protein